MDQQAYFSAPILLEPLSSEVALEMIEVKGGKFLLGGKGRNDAKLVHIPDFYLAKCPITVAQYMVFVEATNSYHPEWLEAGSSYHYQTGTDYYRKFGAALTHPQHPIVGVSWHDAVAFCEWLSAKTGDRYRLPSEAEWEYAARGGQLSQGFAYAGSNKLKEVGWYERNSHSTTAPVGLKLPNELGLYDMSGNVWEWCADHWHDSYKGAPNDGSAWVDAKDGGRRVVRGGSWSLNNDLCRVSDRIFNDSDLRGDLIGFRPTRY